MSRRSRVNSGRSARGAGGILNDELSTTRLAELFELELGILIESGHSVESELTCPGSMPWRMDFNPRGLMLPSVGLSDKIKHWKIWSKPFGLIEVRTVQIQWTSPVTYTTISKLVFVTKFGYTCWLKL